MAIVDNFEKSDKLEWGKNPGLGVRSLHEKGITGRGVNVAIIDQKLRLTHSEYKDSVKSYTEVDDLSNEEVSMHGSGVCSFLCGKSCGVAPEALLNYYATKSGRSFESLAKALRQIIEVNNYCDPDDKVKVVSMSIGFPDDKDEPGLRNFKKELDNALETGIFLFVINRKYLKKNIIAGGSKEEKDKPESYEPAIFLKGSVDDIKKGSIIVPADYRSRANYKDDQSYVYEEEGGMSWAIPYLAGVAALSLQKKPDLKFDEFMTLVDKTANKIYGRFKVINPQGIIKSL